MTTKERLEQIATVLTATKHSPDERLHDLGLRLLAKELNDLDRYTRELEAQEVEEFRAFVANNPSSHPIAQICDESAARVRRIMGRDQ